MSTSPESTTSAKPKRRRLRYGLRTLLVLFVFISAAFAWLGMWIGAAQKEQRAVERIIESGGNVRYEYESQGGSVPPGPKWLHPILGETFFARVEVAGWSEIKLDDEDLDQLRELRRLPQLYLRGCRITDNQCTRIARFVELETLSLRSTPVSDTGIAHLAGHSKLTTLHLDHTAVTDESIEVISRLPSLEHLNVVDTYITSEGIERLKATRPSLEIVWEPAPSREHREAACALEQVGALVPLRPAEEDTDATWGVVMVDGNGWTGTAEDYAHLQRLSGPMEVIIWSRSVPESIPQLLQLPNLGQVAFRGFLSDADLAGLSAHSGVRILSIQDTQVSGAGLRSLSAMQNLAELNTSGPGITDAAMAEIAKVEGLKTLYLFQASIGDEGIKHLGRLENLEVLNIGMTGVTDAAIPALLKMKNLKELDLGATGITDAAIPALLQLTNLKELNIWRTNITDAAIPALLKMTNLKELNIWRTNITPEGVLRLKDGLPDCLVSY